MVDLALHIELYNLNVLRKDCVSILYFTLNAILYKFALLDQHIREYYIMCI